MCESVLNTIKPSWFNSLYLNLLLATVITKRTRISYGFFWGAAADLIADTIDFTHNAMKSAVCFILVLGLALSQAAPASTGECARRWLRGESGFVCMQ